MTTRTFRQQGIGYGPATNVTVKIDGTIVFSGPVPTLDQPPPSLPNPNLQITDTLYTWTNDVSYSGQQSFELTVSSGMVMLTEALANYTDLFNPATGNVVIPGNANDYLVFFEEVVDGVTLTDPFTNEAIDGEPQIEHPDPTQLRGQWWWIVPAGSTFTATLNTSAGNVGS